MLFSSSVQETWKLSTCQVLIRALPSSQLLFLSRLLLIIIIINVYVIKCASDGETFSSYLNFVHTVYKNKTFTFPPTKNLFLSISLLFLRQKQCFIFVHFFVLLVFPLFVFTFCLFLFQMYMNCKRTSHVFTQVEQPITAENDF